MYCFTWTETVLSRVTARLHAINSLSSEKYLDTLKNTFVERSSQYLSFSSRKQPANAGNERKQFTENASVALQQTILTHAHTKCPPVLRPMGSNADRNIKSVYAICFNTGFMGSLGDDDVFIVRARKKEMARTTQKRKFPKGVCVLWHHNKQG